MRVVVGLRNPGPTYDGTRHNIGSAAVAVAAEQHGSKFRKARLGVRAEVTEIGWGDARAVLALPRTFMNESGLAVGPLLRYYRADPSDLVVVHDDIDLPFGRLRVHLGRGTGGHNGVASIKDSLRTADFWRLKMGVGRPPGSVDPADHVLRRFSVRERPQAELMVARAGDLVELIVESGPETARQRAGEMWAQ
ncbi:MAG: aminoacyl-tRNA hydrolase [Acidimicrobiia bacterium]